MIFTCDFVTRENHWQITPLVTKNSLFTVTHALFFISTPHSLHVTYLILSSLLQQGEVKTEPGKIGKKDANQWYDVGIFKNTSSLVSHYHLPSEAGQGNGDVSICKWISNYNYSQVPL